MEPETPAPASTDIPTGPLGRLGSRLRAAREAKGYSVRDLSDQIRIRPALLESLEAGRRDELPADVFVRGFIRSYARCVGVEMDELKTDLERALGAPISAGPVQAASSPEIIAPTIPTLKANKPHPYTVNQRSRGRIAFVVILAGIIGLIVITQVSEPETTVVATKPVETPVLKTGDVIAPLPADVTVEAQAKAVTDEGVLGEGAAGEMVTPAAESMPAEPVSAGAAPAATEPVILSVTKPEVQKPETVTPEPAPGTVPAVAARPPEVSKPAEAVAAKPEIRPEENPPEHPKLSPRPKVVAGFGTRSVQVNSTGESWVIIYQDAKPVYERLMRAGEELEYRFDGDAQLTAGNPSVVTVMVDGHAAPPFRKKSSPSRIKLQ